MFLGGLICENGGKLIKDIRTGAPNVTILAPDGFTPISADVQGSSGTANGMYVSVAGLPVTQLPAAGKAFVAAFEKTIGGQTPAPYSVYAAQAADVILQAIANSDGTRAGVAAELFKVNIPNGILGPISFNKNGDVSANPVTIYKVVNGTVDDLQGHRPEELARRGGLAVAPAARSGEGVSPPPHRFGAERREPAPDSSRRRCRRSRPLTCRRGRRTESRS